MHSEAPEWFERSVIALTCQKVGCMGPVFLLQKRMGRGFLSPSDIITALMTCDDTHVVAFAQWILKGCGYLVARYAWSRDAQCGRFAWDYEATEYHYADAPRSFTTGRSSVGDVASRRTFTVGG